MRCLVTGGAGFIGSELVRQLSGQGHEVIVVDNLANGKKENLAEVRCRLETKDIRDGASLRAIMQGIDMVFHLACLGVRHSIHSPIENHEVNASGTLQLLALAREKDVKRFVYVSSSEVYGTAQSVPMSENHPAFPMTVYGASKLAGECYTRAYHRTYGFPTVVIRPFNTYGPRCHHEGDSGEVIPKFMLRAMADKPMVIFGDGTQTRDFTYVSDTARGIILSGFADAAIGETINLGSGMEISVADLAREMALLLGKKTARTVHEKGRPGDVLRLYADIGKARSLAGFAPRISLAEGLRLLKQWYGQKGIAPEELLKQEKVLNWEK